MSAGAGSHAGKQLLAVDWSKVLEKCTPTVRKGITDLRARHEDLRRLIAATHASIPTLDLAKYRSRLAQSPEHAGLLDEAERKLAAFRPAKMDVTEQLKSLEAQREAKMTEAADFLNRLELEIRQLKDQLQKLREAKPVDEMTVDDVYELYPHIKAEVHESIKNDNWATSPDATEDAKATTAAASH